MLEVGSYEAKTHLPRLLERVARGEAHVQPRVPMDELPVEQRLVTFEEVVAGYTDEQAQAEAARCLACGICSECLSCVYQCGVDAVDQDMVATTQHIDVGAVIEKTNGTYHYREAVLGRTARRLMEGSVLVPEKYFKDD